MKSFLLPYFNILNAVKNKIIWRFLFFGVLLCLTVLVIVKPRPFWGMLPYMGCVVSFDNNDPAYVHQLTYAEFAKHADPKMKEVILERPDNFCKDMLENPDHFSQQFIFYKIKFLYILISWLFYKCGIPLFYAVLLPICLSLFFTGFILWKWLSNYYSLLFTSLFSLVLLTAFFNLQTFRIASPDAMAGVFMLASVFYLTEKRSYSWFSVFLILTVLTRPDALFFEITLSLLLILFYLKNGTYVMNLIAIMLFLFTGLYFLKNILQYDPVTTFYVSFVQPLVPNPQDLHIKFDLDLYLAGLKSGWMQTIVRTKFYVFIGLIVLCFIRRKELSKLNVIIFTAISLAFLVRMFLHPLYEDRYVFMSMDILIVLLLISFIPKQGAPTGL